MSRLLRNIFMFVVYAYLYIPIIILVTNSFIRNIPLRRWPRNTRINYVS